MELKQWYHSCEIVQCESMISVPSDIKDLWYHSQYHMSNHIWYHGNETMIHSSESMISVFSDIKGLWYQQWYWPWYWSWYWLWYHSQPTCNVMWQITQFGYGIMKDFNVSLPSCTGELGQWEELAEDLKSWMVCALRPGRRWQRLQVKVGDGARSLSAPAFMRSEASSSSDANCAGQRAGVAAPAPHPALPGAASGPGETAASDGREHPQRRNHPWVLQVM
jgi:hypothetical protein